MRTLRTSFFVLTLLMTFYLLAAVCRSDFWTGILSPWVSFCASLVLFLGYRKSSKTAKANLLFAAFALACLAWGVGDAAWLFVYLLGVDPSSRPIIWILYALSNCFLLGALWKFAIHRLSKWNTVQFCLDAFIIGIVNLLFIWIVFLKKDISIALYLIHLDFTSVFMITDVVAVMCVLLLYLSVRAGKVPNYIVLISIGVLLFSLNDIFYYYTNSMGYHKLQSLIFSIYLISFYFLALGAVCKKDEPVFDTTAISNTGGRRKALYLFLYPYAITLLEMLGLLDSANIWDIVFCTAAIILYWASCKYVRLSAERETLLQKSNDILEKRIADQIAELSVLANQDTLTNLYNRRYFLNYLEEQIKTKRNGETLTLIFFDLDRFKIINDNYGHNVGDAVLVEISNRMIAWNTCSATIARLGGDEFAIVLVGAHTRKDISNLCCQLIDLCGKPLIIGDRALTVSISVGIVSSSKEANDPLTLMKYADIAMYRAKSKGFNKYQFYNPAGKKDYEQSMEIEVQLKQANIDKDFVLYFQPQFSLPQKELIGAEALIRWKNLTLGTVQPNVFIPVAEEIDTIFEIGKWVMKEAVRQIIEWNRMYSLQLKISINVSPKQFKDDDFREFVRSLVHEEGLDTHWLDVEITESIMLEEENTIDGTISLFKSLGMSVSIDDFGIGYSSLSYVNKYSFDRIKLDKSLIENLSKRDENSANVVKAAISMAHSAGLEVLAEGVKTQEQLDVLTRLGCDQMQGYLLGRPVPPHEFEQRYIRKERGVHDRHVESPDS